MTAAPASPGHDYYWRVARFLLPRHGARAVNDAALAVLGFPALWITEESEALTLQNHLQGDHP